eukprot:7002960-Pyramimonas_sp.AAC.1
MAAHQARLVSAVAARMGKSAAFLFLDLVAAFHRIIRQMACGMQYLEDEPYKILDDCDIPASLVPLASAIIAQPGLLDSPRVDPHLRHLASESQRLT